MSIKNCNVSLCVVNIIFSPAFGNSGLTFLRRTLVRLNILLSFYRSVDFEAKSFGDNTNRGGVHLNRRDAGNQLRILCASPSLRFVFSAQYIIQPYKSPPKAEEKLHSSTKARLKIFLNTIENFPQITFVLHQYFSCFAAKVFAHNTGSFQLIH